MTIKRTPYGLWIIPAVAAIGLAATIGLAAGNNAQDGGNSGMGGCCGMMGAQAHEAVTSVAPTTAPAANPKMAGCQMGAASASTKAPSHSANGCMSGQGMVMGGMGGAATTTPATPKPAIESPQHP